MREPEIRYAEFRATEDTLDGTLIRYGDEATIWGFTEVIEPRALSIRDDLILNLQHDRARPMARLDTKFMSLDHDSEGIDLSLRWPSNRNAQVARGLVTDEILRGLSVEMYVDDEEWTGTKRTIRSGRLNGIGLVDDPAYPRSTLNRSTLPIQLTGVFDISEDRARQVFGGQMLWNAVSVVSTQARKAVRFAPGSLDIESMPVVLLMGNNFDNPLSSSGDAKTLDLSIDAEGVRWAARKLSSTDTSKNVKKLFRQKYITGFRMGFVVDPGNVEQSTVELMGMEYSLDTIREAAMLCDLRLSTAGDGGIGPVKRARVWDGWRWLQ